MKRSDSSLVLLLAVAIDVIFGDPPNEWHPVAWMGTLISNLKERINITQTDADLGTGMGLMAAGLGTVGLAATIVAWVTRYLPRPLAILVNAAVLKSTFSAHGLDSAAKQIQTAILQSDLAEARRLLSWHLVSRNTDTLNEHQLCAATIESVAENTSDGIVAPLFYYTLFGVPGALLYRFCNTADAMLGYRDAEREWLGKFPAKLDDVLNWLPARLTAALMVLGARLIGKSPERTLAVIQDNHQQTDSPNAGYPMSAAAGALDVSLEKIGQYNLYPEGRQPVAEDLAEARKLMWLTVGAATLLSAVLSGRNRK